MKTSNCSYNEERWTIIAVFSRRNLNKCWALSYKARIWEKVVYEGLNRRLNSSFGWGNLLFEKNVLGTSPPQSLLNTVWLNNISHFDLRGCTEQRNLRWDDVDLETDSQGKEYLESRQGNDSRNVRPVEPKIHNNNKISTERNAVKVYKLYRNERPPFRLHATRRSILSNGEPLQIFRLGTAERLCLV